MIIQMYSGFKKEKWKKHKGHIFMHKKNIVMNISDDFDDAFVTDRFRWLLVHVRLYSCVILQHISDKSILSIFSIVFGFS